MGDKGYHSNDTLTALADAEVRTYISEPDRGQRQWKEKPEAQTAVYGNRRRIHGKHGKELLRRRGELLERSFAHAYETGGQPFGPLVTSNCTACPSCRLRKPPA